MGPPPFQAFVRSLSPQTPLRAAITSAYRRPEPHCLPSLIEAATLPPAAMAEATALARRLVERLRAKGHGGGVEGLIHEYALSSQEGVALMCLAEALLRIPDAATVDRLIRDKIAPADWQSHLGHSGSVFVNASTWALMLTGRLLRPGDHDGDLAGVLRRFVARSSEPVWRQAITAAMRILADQFIIGRTIEEGLARAGEAERLGYRHSFDMLGEAAHTKADAERYRGAYQRAIAAIARR